MAKKEKIDRVKMPEQDPDVRRRNFEEVPLGLTEEMAMTEAKRCLQCKKPSCVDGCPVSVLIPEFIKCIAEGDFPAPLPNSGKETPFQRSAAGSVPRRNSVRANAL